MAKFINKLDKYQIIPRDLISDNSMSDRARFLFCYMASKPNDWEFFLEPMAKELGYSIDTLRKYLNELIASGWIEKGSQQNKDGKFGAVEYTLLPEKRNRNEEQAPKNTESENFRVGKTPTQLNKDNKQNKETYKKEEDKSSKKEQKNRKAKVCYNDIADDIDAKYAESIKLWLEYKSERNDFYTLKGFKIMYNNLVKLSNDNADIAKMIIEKSIEYNWRGIFAINANELEKVEKADSVSEQEYKGRTINQKYK